MWHISVLTEKLEARLRKKLVTSALGLVILSLVLSSGPIATYGQTGTATPTPTRSSSPTSGATAVATTPTAGVTAVATTPTAGATAAPPAPTQSAQAGDR